MYDDMRARERLTALWEDIQASLWFVPALCSGAAIAFASLILGLDQSIVGTDAAISFRALIGSPESARAVMGVIAGGMVTIVGVSFSVVVIALVLASNQFSPRLLRNFTADRANQIVLGVFVGNFLYAVLILRSIRGQQDQGGPYVPALGVALGILGSMLALGYFIYFIHHICDNIQVSTIVHTVAEHTRASLEEIMSRSAAPTGPARSGMRVRIVPEGPCIETHGQGYVVRIDESRLVELARSQGVRIDSLVGPGDFLASPEPLAALDREPDDLEAFADGVRDAYVFGAHRTIPEDPAFGFRELSDVALKAISPAVNDPTTACACIDYLGALLCGIVDRDWPSAEFVDEDGEVRLRVPASDFDDYLDLAFSEIRCYGGTDPSVLLHLVSVLGRLAGATRRPERLDALWVQAQNVLDEAERGLSHGADRSRVNREFERLAEALGRDPTGRRLAVERGHYGGEPVSEVT